MEQIKIQYDISFELYKARHFATDVSVSDEKGGILKTVPLKDVTYEKIELSEDNKVY